MQGQEGLGRAKPPTMRLQAIALLVAVLAIPPVAYAVDPDRGGGAAIPPTGGAAAPDPTAPDPAEPTAPPLVPLDAAPAPTGGAGDQSPPPTAPGHGQRRTIRTTQRCRCRCPRRNRRRDGSGSAPVADSGLADTGLELSLMVAAGLSMLGAGLLVLGLVRRPR